MVLDADLHGTQTVGSVVIANVLLGATRELTPLVALQPLYMRPFSAAKVIASLHLLHGRQISINFVSGGFPRDLEHFATGIRMMSAMRGPSSTVTSCNTF